MADSPQKGKHTNTLEKRPRATRQLRRAPCTSRKDQTKGITATKVARVPETPACPNRPATSLLPESGYLGIETASDSFGTLSCAGCSCPWNSKKPMTHGTLLNFLLLLQQSSASNASRCPHNVAAKLGCCKRGTRLKELIYSNTVWHN